MVRNGEPLSDITWEEPPEGEIKYDWPVIAEKVRSQPRTWAKVFDKDRTSLANAIRQGGITALHPDLGFRITTANNTRDAVRTCSLYVMYDPSLDLNRRRKRKRKKKEE